jgi:hypothetical protein
MKRNLTVSDLASMGGKARAKKLSKKEKSEQARNAVQERWRRYREKQKQEQKVREGGKGK